ncbi:MAG: hypothetical protein ACLPID_07500, partial [Beijerinckiaceae bacterium]
MIKEFTAATACSTRREPDPSTLDHDDFGLIQSKIMNVIDSKYLERDMQISLRNLRKLDCAGKPVPTFPHPALACIIAISEIRISGRNHLFESASSAYLSGSAAFLIS